MLNHIKLKYLSKNNSNYPNYKNLKNLREEVSIFVEKKYQFGDTDTFKKVNRNEPKKRKNGINTDKCNNEHTFPSLDPDPN